MFTKCVYFTQLFSTFQMHYYMHVCDFSLRTDFSGFHFWNIQNACFHTAMLFDISCELTCTVVFENDHFDNWTRNMNRAKPITIRACTTNIPCLCTQFWKWNPSAYCLYANVLDAYFDLKLGLGQLKCHQSLLFKSITHEMSNILSYHLTTKIHSNIQRTW